MYPGDDVVDLWGVHYYDTGPKKSTQAIWDQYVNATNDGNPWGIGAWLRAAQAHGKRLGVAEWAIWDQGEGRKADDPVYMDNMARFFRANAGSIAYETYFNTGSPPQPVPEHAVPEGGGALQGRAGAARCAAVWPRAGLAQAAVANGRPPNQTVFNGDHTAGPQVLNTGTFPDLNGPLARID